MINIENYPYFYKCKVLFQRNKLLMIEIGFLFIIGRLEYYLHHDEKGDLLWTL